MRRCTVAFAALFGAALLDLVACNSISGVGDFTFAAASSTASSGGGTSTSTTGGAGSTASAGGSGGAGLAVACVKKKCPVSPDGGACCYENLTEFTDESGRCLDGPPVSDGCITDDSDGGHETRIECSGPDDCPVGICCGTYGGIDADAGTAWYAIVKCETVCDPANNQRVVCDPDGGCPMTDAAMLSCTPSTILPTGYFTCK